MRSRTSPTRTGCAPASWKRSTPSWEVAIDAGRILNGLGVDTQFHYTLMADLDGRLKVKVLLAQALFGKPDIVLLDEPTNNLDLQSVVWLEDFLMDYEGTVLVVSHDRYFLNNVCTHIVDIDYGKIRMYVGNYDFWYESSQLMQKLIKDQNKKAAQKIEELQNFIRRFAANRSKSRQATSRRKLLDKLTVEELPAFTPGWDSRPRANRARTGSSSPTSPRPWTACPC